METNRLFMSEEPNVQEFFVRIVQSISMIIIWLLVNMFIGIYLDYAFFEGSPTIGNYIFYSWFLISGVILFRYLKKQRDEFKKNNPS